MLTGVALLAGCTHILPNPTAYYEDGPRQKQQSEGDLPAETKVLLLIGQRDDYLPVWADNGVIAYVWKGSLVPLRQWEQEQEEKKKRAEAKQREEELRLQSEPPASAPASQPE